MNRRFPALALLALLAALTAGCDQPRSDEGLVARVGPYTLEVEEVARLLVDEEQFGANVGVVREVADLWAQYVLLADAVARDSTLSSVDFAPLVQGQVEQRMILALRDSSLQVDTVVTEEELQEAYASGGGHLQMRARHILLRWPPGGSEEAREELLAQAESLRRRILQGASFQELARRVSQDPGTAPLGGDLGWLSQGDMLPSIERAVLSLQPGEVSEPVESPFGVHLILLEATRTPELGDVAGELRDRVLARRFLVAESLFVAQADSAAAPEVLEGAYELTRDLALDPGRRITGRASRRPLVRYRDGALTVGELQFVLQAQPADLRAQIAAGDDEQIDRFLRSLVQREVLVARARAQGLEPPPEEVDSLVADAREQLLDAAAALGFRPVERAPGEPLEQAVERAALEAVKKVLAGAIEMVRLGPVAYQLRRYGDPVIFERGVGQAVLRIGTLRANRSASPLEQSVDTAGRNP